VLIAGAPATAAEITGTLPEPGVVWISDGSKPTPMSDASMKNAHKTFVPELLVVTAGSNVRFPNEDPFYHSIYSESQRDPFDLGYYDMGPGKVVPFAQPGIVDVRCHVHQFMRATIVVVDGPWAQTAEPGQTYTLRNVRPGQHRLHAWTPGGGEKISDVAVGS